MFALKGASEQVGYAALEVATFLTTSATMG